MLMSSSFNTISLASTGTQKTMPRFRHRIAGPYEVFVRVGSFTESRPIGTSARTRRADASQSPQISNQVETKKGGLRFSLYLPSATSLKYLGTISVCGSSQRSATACFDLVRRASRFQAQEYGSTSAGNSQNRIVISVLFIRVYHRPPYFNRADDEKTIYQIYLPLGVVFCIFM